MNAKKWRKTILHTMIILFASVICGLGFCRWSIQTGLETWSEAAQNSHPHPGDAIAAMIEYVQTDSHSLKERNFVVWALGQARDSRALPILESFYSGDECDHALRLCQGELAKAIELCRGNAPNVLFIRMP